MEEQKNEDVTSNVLTICKYDADITYPGQKKFDCGNKVINDYVAKSLKSNVRNGDAYSQALIDVKTGDFFGFFSCTGYSLARTRLAGVFEKSLPSEVFVIRLVMLGVSIDKQKKEYGLDLMQSFFEHALKVHETMPIKGVFLDADPEAVNFYTRLGFIPLPEPSHGGVTPMFLKIQDLVKATAS
ncbi:N-acetyltransferase [Aeromonas hydrophila]|uniref:hypothetical protein n=1 Tax=Aeromonas hydrophila TaxID=644 RepID=UPI001C78CF4C|nr:hypothetical protein [Aeromonas hydrophila]QWL72078.1 N-acetyltransferase [Aeromonas hydrophila]